ncbi:MAG: Na/Pi cotransporter family protein [Chlamydiae bacterium]|nr:Na/Pi cotransporter family protein [Chlamydiota bacterium]MBI3266233.1 Na/Pi cotransporter family protein [Chlamydiota bacterium]
MLIPILKLIGGLTLFLYGLDLASTGLQEFAAQRMRVILNWATRSHLAALFFGILSTLTLQSSSVTSVMLVSFVNSSLVGLEQALAILLGANIGTTFTVQILAFDLSSLALAGVALGFALMKFFQGERLKSLGRGLLGFALSFYGIGLMNAAFGPLKDVPWVAQGLIWIGHSFSLGFFAALLLTALIHSSAAAIVLVMTLVSQGSLSPQESVAWVLGANVGTCVSALFASLGRGANAWRLSVGHLMMKLTGVALVIPLLPLFGKWVHSLTEGFWPTLFTPSHFVANTHTLFNGVTSLVLLPGTKWAGQFLRWLIPAPVRKPYLLEEEGLSGVRKGLSEMADRVGQMILDMLNVFRDNDAKLLKKIIDADEEIDLLNFHFVKFLTQKASGKWGSQATQEEVRLLYGSDQLEHIGDLISKDLAVLARKKIRKDLEFSMEGQTELEEFHQMVYHLFRGSFWAFAEKNRQKAQEMVEGSEVAKRLKRKMYLSHLERLRKSIRETVATSAIHLDFITDLDRILDHALHLARTVLE